MSRAAGLPVSVLTLVKGRRTHFRYLLESLARMKTPPGELIVVNLDAAPLHPPRLEFPVRVLHHPAENLPLGAARNRAAAAAQYRLLCFLDVDCVVSARSIERATTAIARQDCMLAPEMLYLPAHAMGTDWREGALRRIGLRHPARNFPPSGEQREHNPGFLWSVAFLMRARTFYALGGFDEVFTGYGAEDTDLGFRGNEAGLPLIYQGGAPIFHQHHTLYWPPLQHFPDIVRNSLLFHQRWGIWPMLDRLGAFQEMGLIDRTETTLRVLRYPTPAEIAAARQGDEVIF
jgi:GT2 family glycosyltransferase